VLDHDDGVRAWRDRGARHDFDRVTCPEHEFGMLAGADFARDPQRPGEVRGPYGESVAHGAVEGRVIPIGDRIPRQNTPERGIQPNCLRLRDNPFLPGFAPVLPRFT
jgi:hypothetical protein